MESFRKWAPRVSPSTSQPPFLVVLFSELLTIHSFHYHALKVGGREEKDQTPVSTPTSDQKNLK